MKSQLRVLGLVLILVSLVLTASFITGAVTPTESVGPQRPVGPGPSATDIEPQGQVGPDMAGVGPGAGNVMIFGIDWVYVVASGLVLVALGAGLAIGRGPRRHTVGN
jgi:hypothetical protein